MPENTPCLTIDNAGKLYQGKVWALRHFSLQLRAGVLGLLGPNGAGKSTLMNILATTTRATEGTVAWNGTRYHGATRIPCAPSWDICRKTSASIQI